MSEQDKPSLTALPKEVVAALRQAQLDIMQDFRHFDMMDFHCGTNSQVERDRALLLEHGYCKTLHCIGGYMHLRLPNPNFQRSVEQELEEYFGVSFSDLFYPWDWESGLNALYEQAKFMGDRKAMAEAACHAIDHFIENRGVAAAIE